MLTVWHRQGIPPSAWRFRGIFRYVLPLTDLLFLWFGVVGWNNGIASLQEATSNQWQTWWSLAVAISAVGAFVGVAFPALWKLELMSKVFLVGLVSAYVALFLLRGISEPLVAATAGLIVILILLPMWRIADLSVTLRRWRRRVS